MLRYRQRSIRSEGDAADSTPLVALQQRQMELITDAQRNASQLAAVTGIPEFQIAVEEMKLVRDHFAANETSSAIEQMELAEVALEENDETLFTVISVLHGLPSIEIAEQTDPALIRLIEVLAVASEHQLLLRRTADACLLYTSPSPRDLSTSRMPSSA